AHLRLSLAALGRAPVEDGDGEVDRGRGADMLPQPRRPQRVRVEAAVERVGELRSAVGTCDEDLLLGGPLLRLELRELGPALDGLVGDALDLARRGGERRKVSGREGARLFVADE